MIDHIRIQHESSYLYFWDLELILHRGKLFDLNLAY